MSRCQKRVLGVWFAVALIAIALAALLPSQAHPGHVIDDTGKEHATTPQP